MQYLVVIWLLIGILQAQTPVTFVIDPVSPYVKGKMGQLPTGGCVYELIQDIFEQIPGFDAVFLPLSPYTKAQELVQKGEVDALPFMLYNQKREEQYFFSRPLLEAQTVLAYTLKRFPDGFTWHAWDDFRRHSFCVLDGLSAQRFLGKKRREGLPIEIYAASTTEDCLKLIDLGRLDFVVDNNQILEEVIHRDVAYSNVRLSGQPLYIRNFHIAFSKKTQAHELIPQINTIILQIESQKSLDTSH